MRDQRRYQNLSYLLDQLLLTKKHVLCYVTFSIRNFNSMSRGASITMSMNKDKPITIYGSQGSRSPLVNWYCHEINLPFKMESPTRTPHPFGQIPCVKDEKTVLFESGAILMYLGKHHSYIHLYTYIRTYMHAYIDTYINT